MRRFKAGVGEASSAARAFSGLDGTQVAVGLEHGDGLALFYPTLYPTRRRAGFHNGGRGISGDWETARNP